MSEFLIVRLGRHPEAPCQWIAVDQTGALLSRPASGALTEAAGLSPGRTVICLAPAADVLRTRLDVPVKGAAKIMQALPFAMEEHLAEDVDALHFAAGARGADGRVPVAVVRRDLVTEWLAQCAAAGLQPQQLFAESDALGGIPNTTVLLAETGGVILAEPDGNVATADLANLELLLELWLADTVPAEDPDVPRPARHLVIYCEAALARHLEPLWEKLRGSVDSLEVRGLGEDGALPRLAAQAVNTPGLNLLQGPFTRRSSLMAYWPAWRAAAGIAAAFIVVYLGVQVAELRQLQARAAVLDQAIDQAFHYVFPDAGEIRDARAQFESRLKQLGSANDMSHEFLDSLQTLAAAVGESGAARIEALSYRSGVLDLRLRAPSVETLDRIQQAVARSGTMKAEIQSANAAGDEVLGRIQITRSGS